MQGTIREMLASGWVDAAAVDHDMPRSGRRLTGYRTYAAGAPPTLGDWLDGSLIIRANCTTCGHHAVLGIPELVARHGTDLPVIALNGHFVCERCGARGGRVTCSPRCVDGMGPRG